MNILPHKKWHVRTKENMARVRKDEAKALEAEKVRAERESLAEKEFRTRLLRDKAASARSDNIFGASSSSSTAAPSDITLDTNGHVNFFAELEAQERTFGKNTEAEESKRKEQEEMEQKIGILKYLGEGSAEYMKNVPWYQKAAKRPYPEVPIIKKAVEVKSEAVPTKKTVIFPSELIEEEEPSRKKKRKDKKKHKKRRRQSSSSEEEEEDSKNSELQKLRAARLKREAEEAKKQAALLRGGVEVKKKSPTPPRYSSQFNPEFARQNRKRNSDQ